jgi:hypothetical protein
MIGLMREVLVKLGCEVIAEDGGFRYRLKDELRMPFLFSGWHRITRTGPDVLAHPPAQVIPPHELEDRFFPLRVCGPREKPLLVSMDRNRAEQVMDFPEVRPVQKGLFDHAPGMTPRQLRLGNIAYRTPAVLRTIRKGLPLLFYVNGVGAVGTARIQEWTVTEPENLHAALEMDSSVNVAPFKEHVATNGSCAGQVLAMEFHWYRPFKRAVPLSEIRCLDPTFNPQRTRNLPDSLFQALVEAGHEQDRPARGEAVPVRRDGSI